jgi:elongation factor P--(R)-beta-lysine ligase
MFSDYEYFFVMNKKVDQILWERAQIVDAIRLFFKERNYLEVETPIVTLHPGMEPHLDYFQTEYVSKSGAEREQLFLNHSPELEMKKLLGRGYDKVFQMGKVFRNGEGGFAAERSKLKAESGEDELYYLHHSEFTHSTRFARSGQAHDSDQDSLYKLHHYEFTMCEWYQVGKDYNFLMDETEEMVRSLCGLGGLDEEMCDLIDRDWERVSVKEAFLKYAGIDLDECREIFNFQFSIFNEFSISNDQRLLMEEWSWDDLFFWVMLNGIEPHFGKERPTLLYDYPASQAALARKKQSDPFWAERFELYIDGVELCNGFSELCDPVEQRERLWVEQEERRQMGKVVPEIDDVFLSALGQIESATGNALGVDRLIMLLLGKRDVREVMVV